MSMTWDQHIAAVNGYIADQRARRAAKLAAAQAAVPQTPVTPPLPQPGPFEPQQYGGEMGQGMYGGGAAGDISGLAGAFGLNGQSVGGLLGALGGGLVGGPVGGLLGALAGRGIGGYVGGGLGGYGGYDGGSDPANAQSGASENSAANSGAAQGGNMMGDGTFKKGGYTGAGKDGVVQPHKPAGVVHEGELVIPHHMVKKMMRGLLSR